MIFVFLVWDSRSGWVRGLGVFVVEECRLSECDGVKVFDVFFGVLCFVDDDVVVVELVEV